MTYPPWLSDCCVLQQEYSFLTQHVVLIFDNRCAVIPLLQNYWCCWRLLYCCMLLICKSATSILIAVRLLVSACWKASVARSLWGWWVYIRNSLYRYHHDDSDWIHLDWCYYDDYIYHISSHNCWSSSRTNNCKGCRQVSIYFHHYISSRLSRHP